MNKKIVIGIGVATAITIAVVYYRKQRQKQFDAGTVVASGSGSTPAPISNLRPSSQAQAIRSNEVAPVYPVAPIAQKVQQPIAIAQTVKASEPVYMPSPAPAPVRSMVIQPSTSLPQPSEAKREFLAQRQVAIAGWDLLR